MLLAEAVPLSTEVAPPQREQLCVWSSLVPGSGAPADCQEGTGVW